MNAKAATRDIQVRVDGAREKIEATAYDLFSRFGTRTIGVDRIVAESGVAKMSLYRHFRSKQELVAAFMERRDSLWTNDWLKAEVERRSHTPRQQLLAIFDVFDEWFAAPRFESCAFIRVLLEYPDDDDLHGLAAGHLADIRKWIVGLLHETKIEKAQARAAAWHMLMKGCIIAASEGDRAAAKDAKEAAMTLLAAWAPLHADNKGQ